MILLLPVWRPPRERQVLEVTADEVIDPDEDPPKREDPVFKALLEHDLNEGMGVALAYARAQAGKPHWPIGLCIAWVHAREEEEATSLYARHRVGTELRPIDGWPAACASVQHALMAGRIQGFGLCSDGSNRIAIAPHEWIDVKIRQRGPFDEMRGANGSISWRDVRIPKASAVKEWPAESPTIRQKRERERSCLEALKQRMATNLDRPIAKKTLRLEFPGVAERPFDALFSKAVAETGATAWSTGGRRRKATT